MQKQSTKYDSHWRDSALRPRFFGIDARAALLLLCFLFHMRMWTFFLSLTGILSFSLLGYFGLRIEVVLRWIRNRLAGQRKIAIPWWIAS